MVGGSSLSLIVPVAVAFVASVAFDGLDSVSVKVSSGSSVLSSTVATANVAVVSFTATVTIPVAIDRSVKSSDSAVSPLSIDAVQVAVTACVLASDSVTVKVTPLPSVAEAPATLSSGSVALSFAVTAFVGALASLFANAPTSVQLAFAVSAAPRSSSTTV